MSKNITIAFGALIVLLLAAGALFGLSACTKPSPTPGNPEGGNPDAPIHNYALATDLPTDLPDEAPLYYLRSTEAVSDT
ncbi:MAG: hypothetical protein U9Q78_04940 [Chloroflexota bacterium]|nr:hypothetical protein [Chloroflexota bacterium]